MFRIETTGPSSRYCDGISRRSFLQLGVAGMASVSLADLLWAKEASASLGREKKNTSVILIWLEGGPPHIDMYDMKPDAPAEYRGIWRPMRTNVSGIEISELFPRQAKVADKFSIVRSLHHDHGGHLQGSRLILTGREDHLPLSEEAVYPSVGSIATKVLGSRRRGMPAYVGIPYAAAGSRPGHFGASYLGLKHNPLDLGRDRGSGDPNRDDFKVENIQIADGMTVDRLENRQGLQKRFDRLRREMDTSGTFEAMDAFQYQAFDLVGGPAAQKAFDIGSEDPRLRERYGRNSWGQTALLARRLVEAGSTFVTCHFGGWDDHWDLEAAMNNQLPRLDMAVASLYEDLDARGLLDQVLVVVCGEFGRTPRMNNGRPGGIRKGTPGRDHWGNSMSCVMAGGGVKGGQIVGSTDRLGETPKDRPLTPSDIHATIYHVLGVDPHISFLDFTDRPIPAVESGKVIHELV